jgi:hypothetical protein
VIQDRFGSQTTQSARCPVMTMLIESAFLKVLRPRPLADDPSGAPEVYTERLLERIVRWAG